MKGISKLKEHTETKLIRFDSHGGLYYVFTYIYSLPIDKDPYEKGSIKVRITLRYE